MTKVIILGEEKKEVEFKKIEFLKFLNIDYKIKPSFSAPSEWENIELITRCYNKNFDLMYAYDDNRNAGVLFLGHFNDGIV